jgi:choline dehydrogenase-like flavoprotein
MFDYIMVGGGSAGCVLAGRLRKTPNVQVCLLEAGPADRSVLIHCPAGLALMAKSGQLNWALSEHGAAAGPERPRGYQPRGKVLGGSSSVNAMIYARGHRRLRPLGRRRATPAGAGTMCCPTSSGRAQRARRRRLHGRAARST